MSYMPGDDHRLEHCTYMPRVVRHTAEPLAEVLSPSVRVRHSASSFVVNIEVLLVLDVTGRPASYSSASEAAWKAAVRAAISETGRGPWTGRFSVSVEFRTPQARNANEVWDLDNLIKPTLDAMEGVFGLRAWRGPAQAADDRVDHLEAAKRTIRDGESPGARIEIRRLIS